MKLFEIERCGIFDSKKTFRSLKESEKRKIENFEIEYVLSSNGTSFIDDKSCKLSSGIVLIRKPNQISYSKLHFKNYYISLVLQKNSDYYNFLNGCPSFFLNINSKEYLEIFQSLIKNTSLFGTKSDSELISIDILRLLYSLKRDSIYNNSNNVKRSTPLISKIMGYIDHNFQNKILLCDLANHFGYSQFYLQKRFKDITGLSPNDYILEKRINMAKLEMMNTDSKITEIAYNCGFSSQSYFCYSFKFKTGLTPNEYRKSVNNNYKL